MTTSQPTSPSPTLPRLELFEFENLQAAFADLAFNNAHNNHGAPPRNVPLQTSLKHVANLGCKTIVKQHSVQDPDFLAEYFAYYSRMFGEINKYCHRFHFFSLPTNTNEDVLDFIDRAAGDSNNYLGFITIRPVRSSPVAATILRALPDHHFLLSSDDFDVHIAGRKFSVCGTPFMQQDNAVGACAQASIWMALRTLRKKEGNSAFDPAQITSAATRFLVRGRTLPNREGLVVEQMIEAIRFAGYSPHIMQFGADNRLLSNVELVQAKRKIYAYIESEIPVVLGVFPGQNEGHAVVLIGHKWQQSSTASLYSNLNGLDVFHAADWVTCYISHNDNSGPYLDLPEKTVADYTYSLEQVRFAIPLLPSDVFMTGEEAELVSLDLFKQLQISSASHSSGSTTPSSATSQELVFRTYLAERHKFREWVANSHGMHHDVKKYYRLKRLPKRIWVTEINLKQHYNDVCTGSLCRVGEILIDPTGEPSDAPFLSIHVNASAIVSSVGNGVIIDKGIDRTAIVVTPVVGDTAYSPLCRK